MQLEMSLQEKQDLMKAFIVPKDTFVEFFWLDKIVTGLHIFLFVSSEINREIAKQPSFGEHLENVYKDLITLADERFLLDQVIHKYDTALSSLFKNNVGPRARIVKDPIS